MSTSGAAHLVQQAYKQLQYINGRQDGDTPAIERAAMAALRDLRAALRELGVGVPAFRASFTPHTHAHGSRGSETHRDPRRGRLTAGEARAILRAAHADRDEDFHALGSASVDHLVEAARKHGYRKPKNANGSTARYFYSHLERVAGRG